MSKNVAVIGIIGQKGGGGKTTIAINLAVAAARHKLAAVIIDLDQQTNSAKWRDRRRSDNVAVVATPASPNHGNHRNRRYSRRPIHRDRLARPQ